MKVKAFARAPAKVILLGEHFVVHGGYAIAVPVDLWVRVRAEGGEGLAIRSSIVGECSGPSPGPGLGPGPGCPHELEPFYHMLEGIAREHPGAMGSYEVESEIPPGMGLGSSAAVAAALAASALAMGTGSAPKDAVFRHAMESERAFHGNPSGVDPAVSTYGDVVLYSQRDGIRRLSVGGGEVLVCCSRRPRSTASMVGLVESFRRSRPELFEPLLRTSSALVLEAAGILESGGGAGGLAQIVRWHHQALRLLGVSNEELDGYVEALDAAGYASKLTGAGGGGCVVAMSMQRATPPAGLCDVSMALRYPSGGVDAWVAP